MRNPKVLPLVDFTLPGAWLRDSLVAASIRDQGCAVTACGDDELDLAVASDVIPSDVVIRCASDSATIRRGASFGVMRYVVSTERHIAVLAENSAFAKHVYLEERGPVVLGERRLNILGMHCEVGDYRGPSEWAAAVERLLARASAIDGALDEGCTRWRLPRPAVVLTPSAG